MADRSAALLEHIVARVEQDVQFLVDQHYISAQDAAVIVARLPGAAAQAPTHVVVPVQAAVPAQMLVASPPPTYGGTPKLSVQRARALWAYNENGKDNNDLSFAAGDVIEITEETNDDWWTGRANGRQGLFPSNYVEKLQETSATGSRKVPSLPVSGKKEYKPFKASYHSGDTPSGATNSIGLQQDARQDAKKEKTNGLKNTMMHSAAGGAGFGAGAAIGGGLVRAIF